jgi:hypothetical protein
MTRASLFIAATVLALGVAAPSAQAQTSRAWVSGHGSDVLGCGLVTSPCRTPQFAHDHIVSAGGEIDVLDPAGYGSITITKAISIVNDGVGTAGFLAPAQGSAITINAGSTDAIQLRGLTIEGSGTGYNGIFFGFGGSLTVTDCVVQNFFYDGVNIFTGNGILVEPSAGTFTFTITNTIVSNNGFAGIFYYASSGTSNATWVIDHVTATDNKYGIDTNTSNASAGSTTVTISNTVVSNNTTDGIYIVDEIAGLTVSIDNASVTGNGDVGIYAANTPQVLLGRSVIVGNNIGIANNTSPSNTFYSYKDNRINLNTDGNIAGTALNSLTSQ